MSEATEMTRGGLGTHHCQEHSVGRPDASWRSHQPPQVGPACMWFWNCPAEGGRFPQKLRLALALLSNPATQGRRSPHSFVLSGPPLAAEPTGEAGGTG